MSLIVAALILLLAAAIAYHVIDRIPRLLPRSGGSRGPGDPRVAVAAMMYAVATEHGPLTAGQERHIEQLLCSKMADAVLEANQGQTAQEAMLAADMDGYIDDEEDVG